jgi:hypothetical protein
MKDRRLKSKLAQLNAQNNLKLNREADMAKQQIVEDYKNHLQKAKKKKACCVDSYGDAPEDEKTVTRGETE